jgi:hypothetical protein
MSRKNDPDNEWLRERLRAWDPVKDGNELDGRDRARMRRRVLAATSEPVRLGLPVRALAAAAVVVLIAALGWGIYDDAVMQPPGTVPASSEVRQAPAADPADEAERKSRQIQFSTPGGTRVVWTLDPDFEV